MTWVADQTVWYFEPHEGWVEGVVLFQKDNRVKLRFRLSWRWTGGQMDRERFVPTRLIRNRKPDDSKPTDVLKTGRRREGT